MAPLDEDCTNCAGPYAAVRGARRAAIVAWETERITKVDAYLDVHADGLAAIRWLTTDEAVELFARAPADLPEHGCPECNWTGRQPTDAGRQVLALLRLAPK